MSSSGPQASQMSKGPSARLGPTTRTRLAWWIMLLAAIGFVAGGSYAIVRGLSARSLVHTQLLGEGIITAEDSSIPNVPVEDHATAHAQAEAIQRHTLEATGGLTYAQLDRDDPLRELAFRGAMLRTALLSGALAWHLADLAIGVGVFITVVGLLMLAVLVLMRPTAQGEIEVK